MAHDEPPHQDLRYLPSSLRILDMIELGCNIFRKFADQNFVVCFLVVQDLRPMDTDGYTFKCNNSCHFQQTKILSSADSVVSFSMAVNVNRNIVFFNSKTIFIKGRPNMRRTGTEK